MTSSCRWDLRLEISPVVKRALSEMLGERGSEGGSEGGSEAADQGHGGSDGGGSSPLGAVLHSLAGGGEAEVWELAALVSAPKLLIASDCF